jgi:hypothetical protein
MRSPIVVRSSGADACWSHAWFLSRVDKSRFSFCSKKACYA